MFENDFDCSLTWDVVDIQMSIKRYFYNRERGRMEFADREIEFLRGIHHEWSYNPLMRRTSTAGIAVVDDFLKWFDGTADEARVIEDFTVQRLIRKAK